MYRYKAIVEYYGTYYHGMQKQPNKKTIQSCLELAISQTCNNDIKIQYCGRTDAGVHAIGQVIHFDLQKEREPMSLLRGINYFLKTEEISIKDISLVDSDFHSRFNASRRWYVYKILNRYAKSSLYRNTHLHIPSKIDINKMYDASRVLIGKHDFAAFSNYSEDQKTTERQIYTISTSRREDELEWYFCANSFLYNMIRNIMGSLIEIGVGKRDVAWLGSVLESRDRKNAGVKIAPHGLYFLRAEY